MYFPIRATSFSLTQAQNIACITSYAIFNILIWLIIFNRPTSKRLTEKYSAEFKDLRAVKQELATRVVATFHALVTFLVGAYLLLTDPALKIGNVLEPWTFLIIERSSYDMQTLCCFSAAFFACDILLCSILLKENGILFWIHAVAGFTGVMYGVALNEGHMFIAVLFLWEGSTPFLHLRWFLMEYDMKETVLFAVTNALLAIFFVFFRIVIGIPVTLYLVYDINSPRHHQEVGIPICLAISIASLSTIGLNLSWGSYIIKKALQTIGILKNSSSKKKKS